MVVAEKEADKQTTGADTASLPSAPILFFDGVCGLCNHSVDFVIARDRQRRFFFAPLQGETAKQYLSPRDTEQFDTIVFFNNQRTFRHSTAVVRILWELGHFWRLCAVLLWCVPWPIRHLGYKLTSKIRYRLFGKKESCRLPTTEERDRFLR